MNLRLVRLGILASAAVMVPSFASAQTTGGTTTTTTTTAAPGNSAVGGVPAGYNGPVQQRRVVPEEPLLMGQGTTWALGWRAWMVRIPREFVSLFATVEPGWPGSTNIGTGPEAVYRSGNFEIALSAMFVSFAANPAYIRGLTDPQNATEEIRSSLFAVYVTSHFNYGIRLNRYFEIQIGAGVGAGVVGGDLTRWQTYRTPGTNGGMRTLPNGATQWTNCEFAGNPADTFGDCMANNNHYSGMNVGTPQSPAYRNPYREPNWTGQGYVPLILPWLSIPHVAFHVRPHRNVDFKLELGYGLINYYAGGSIHFVL